MIQNAKLQNAFKLSSKITLYIPATIHDKEIDNSSYVDAAALFWRQYIYTRARLLAI